MYNDIMKQVTWLVVTEVRSESFRLVTERRHYNARPIYSMLLCCASVLGIFCSGLLSGVIVREEESNFLKRFLTETLRGFSSKSLRKFSRSKCNRAFPFTASKKQSGTPHSPRYRTAIQWHKGQPTLFIHSGIFPDVYNGWQYECCGCYKIMPWLHVK